MYLLTDREIIDALRTARGRGVDVRVILEAQPTGGGSGNRPAINDLRAANVNVKTSNPTYRLTHEDADWNRVAPTVANPNLVWSPVNARRRLTALIDNVKQTLDIETEEMQNRDMEDHLSAAVQRGVTVRVVMSPPQSGNDANAAGQGRITRGGVQLRLVKTPYVHAKMTLADSARAFVGSQNISTASLDSNRELGILIADSRVIQVLSQTFAPDWNIGR